MPIPGSVLNNPIPVLGSVTELVYPSKCTIYHRVNTPNSAGEPVNTYTTPVDSRHTNIPCRKSPEIMVRPQQQERPSGLGDQQQAYWIISLLGDYTDIDLQDQAEVDGKRYQIQAVDGDGNKATTRIEVGDLDPFNA